MPPARSNRPEILDLLPPTVSQNELRQNLSDIRRSNRHFGGTRLMADTATVIGLRMGSRSLLDLATGSADIPSALVDRAERLGWPVQIVATDLHPAILSVARQAEIPGRLAVQRADARCLPYANRSFDLVTCALALHHFDAGEAVTVLGEMRRVARHAMIVTDLARSWAGLLGAWLFGTILSFNRLTRHDAPLSARRAYTPDEALAMARSAGWQNAMVKRAFPFRFILVGRP